MQQATKRRLLEFVAPILSGIIFIFKVVYYIVFAWWLDPLLQQKAERALLDDITKNLYFLVSDGQNGARPAIKMVRSEWPTAEILWENLLFTVIRWRDETSITVAPSHVPAESYELGPLLAALESKHFSERYVIYGLADAGDLLRPRLQALNTAFSKEMFPHIKAKL